MMKTQLQKPEKVARMNMKVSAWSLGVCLLVMPLLQASDSGTSSEPSRTWTSLSGDTLQATYQKLQSGNVHLLSSDGKAILIPLTRLSPEDRAYVHSLSSADTPKAGVSGTSRGRTSMGNMAGTYKGDYRWKDKSGAMSLKLVPQEATDTYTASFECTYEGKTHSYKGMLKTGPEGKLTGIFSVKKADDYSVDGTVSGGQFKADLFLRQWDGTLDKEGGFSVRMK